MNAVIDTNVVVSSFISPAEPPASIVLQWGTDVYTPIVSDPILEEYRRTLRYPRIQARHGLTDEEIDRAVDRLRETAVRVVPQEHFDVIERDPSDNMFLDCAVAGEADFIVSGDAHLRDLVEFRGIRIVSPAAFVTLLNQRNGSE